MKARRDVRTDHIREVLLFDGCSEAELERIAASADEVAVPPGYVLVFEGDWGDEVFVVAEGVARVTAGGRLRAELGAGAVIGELAMLNRAPRTATVTASTAMRFFVFGREAFETILAELPIVTRRMMSEVASRYQAAADQETIRLT